MSSYPSPSRRALLRAAAWTVPTVTVVGAAPAFAISPGKFVECDVQQYLDFSAYPTTATAGHPPAVPQTSARGDRLDVTTATWTLPATLKSTYTVDSGATYSAPTVSIITTMTNGWLRHSDSTSSGVANGHFRFLTLGQTASISGNDTRAEMLAVRPALKLATDTVNRTTTAANVRPTMEVTLSFPAPVKNLSFLLTDIDSNGQDQTDRVWIKEVSEGGAARAYTAVRPSPTNGRSVSYTNPTGANAGKTESSAWVGNDSVGNESNRGNLLIKTNEGVWVDKVVFCFQNSHNVTGARNNSLNLADVNFTSRETVCLPS